MAGTSLAICLACGGLANVKDRRVLGVGEKVTLLWEKTISMVLLLEKKQFDFKRIISNKEGYMCRKCFYAYGKFVEKEEVSYVHS